MKARFSAHLAEALARPFRRDMGAGRLARIRARLEQSPAAARLLAAADAAGWSIDFDASLRAGGACVRQMAVSGRRLSTGHLTHDFMPEPGGRILLCPRESDAALCYMLAHELRHAWQHGQVAPDLLTINRHPEAAVRAACLAEADACTAQLVVAHELALAGDAAPLAAMARTRFGRLADVFAAAATPDLAPSDDEAAQQAAFAAWFADRRTVRLYEDQQRADRAAVMELLGNLALELAPTAPVTPEEQQALATGPEGKCWLPPTAALRGPRP